VIVPSEKLVVVRMGISLWYGDHTGDLVAAVIAALHRRPDGTSARARPDHPAQEVRWRRIARAEPHDPAGSDERFRPVASSIPTTGSDR
jgi:hypothetical protein